MTCSALEPVTTGCQESRSAHMLGLFRVLLIITPGWLQRAFLQSPLEAPVEKRLVHRSVRDRRILEGQKLEEQDLAYQ